MADEGRVKRRVGVAKQRAVQGARSAKQHSVAIKSRRPAAGFVSFIRDRGIVGMAIGLAIGTVAAGTVKVIVQGFITPLVEFIVGSHKHLESQIWHVQIWGRMADFQWGAVLSSIITLAATVFVIYLLVRMAKLDRLDKDK